MTLHERLVATGYRPSGFDYLRLILAVAVLCTHTLNTAYAEQVTGRIWETWGPAFKLLLPMFFALSGFLVAGSLERSKTVAVFLGLRVIRIYPALIVEVLLSAFILGPMVTNLSLPEYFTDPLFFQYLWNIVGHPHYLLPGVFQENPLARLVNGQLWTVPFELACYVVLGALAVLGGRRNRTVVLVGSLAVVALAMAHSFYRYGFDLPAVLFALSGKVLVLNFLGGVCLYLYKDRIPDSLPLFLVACVVTAVCMIVGGWSVFALAPFVSYVVAYLGLRNPGRIGLLKGADYSYGIFLYHYVIQQFLMSMFPWAREWYWNLLLTLPLVSAFAAFSWLVVEKPAMRLKPYLSRWEARHLARRKAASGPGTLGRILGWPEG